MLWMPNKKYIVRENREFNRSRQMVLFLFFWPKPRPLTDYNRNYKVEMKVFVSNEHLAEVSLTMIKANTVFQGLVSET